MLARILRAMAAAFDPSVAELYRVCYFGQAQGMVEHLTDLAKMGYTAEQMGIIAHAAERGEILSFEYGRIRRIGTSRTLQQIKEEGW